MDMQGLRNMGMLPADGASVGTARMSPPQAVPVQPQNGSPGMPAQNGGVPLVG